MRRLFAVIMLLLSSAWAVNAQTLNCERAFTRMEQAICGNSSLLDSYGLLNQLTERAIRDEALSIEAADEFKNKLARSCRLAENLENCLDQELSSAVSVLAGVSSSLPESTLIEERSERLLRSQVTFAERAYSVTGNPESIIVALLAMLQHYEKLPQTPTTIVESSALSNKLLKGCQDLTSRRRWNRVLQTYGWSCPLNYASNDLE